MNKGIVENVKILATGRNVLISLFLSTTVYLIMIVYTIPGVKKYAPVFEIFDLSPMGYSYIYSMQLLETLGPDGRNAYLYSQLPVDFIYPLLFATSFCLLWVWMVEKLNKKNNVLYYLGFMPVVAGLLDYMENFQIAFMLRTYPDVTELQVATASATTISKSVLTSLCFVFLLLGMLRILWDRRKALFFG